MSRHSASLAEAAFFVLPGPENTLRLFSSPNAVPAAPESVFALHQFRTAKNNNINSGMDCEVHPTYNKV